ncbi:hypothetical protein [Streptomyces sp. NPDC021139]|uniref:alpha/beta fold hydrolase n=1 Tax=unclassified Streptomyces TaxID=2593676 RepID=UPI0033E82ED6
MLSAEEIDVYVRAYRQPGAVRGSCMDYRAAYDVLDVWKGMARDVRGVAIARCGHLCQEERPEVVNAELLAFLEGWNG